MGNNCSASNQLDGSACTTPNTKQTPPTTIRLSTLEKLIAKFPSSRIGTVTFYEGQSPESYLRERVEAIVAKNPWLAATLEKRDGELVAEYGPNNGGRRCFEVASERDVSPDNSDYEGMVQRFEDCLGPKSNAAVGSGFPVFQVVLVPDAQHERFAMVMTMDHVVGDGYTFYAVHNSLSSDAEIAVLDPVRLGNDYEAALSAALGTQENKDLSQPGAATIFASVRDALFGRKPDVFSFEVENDTIAQHKNQTSEAVDFISTNDILTSWYFKQTDALHAQMAINMRGRLENVDSKLAGNYEAVVAYRPEDYSSPSQIRQSISTPGTYRRTTNSRLPGTWTRLKNQTALITNWGTFYEDVVLTGCTQTLHTPVFDLSFFSNPNVAVIFKPRKGATAIFFATRTLSSDSIAQDELFSTRLF